MGEFEGACPLINPLNIKLLSPKLTVGRSPSVSAVGLILSDTLDNDSLLGLLAAKGGFYQLYGCLAI